MALRAAYASVALLCGCAVWPESAHRPTPAETYAVSIAAGEWGSEPCESFWIAIEQEPGSYCYADVDSCLTQLKDAAWPVLLFSDFEHVMVLNASLDSRGQQTALIHETLHLMQWCDSGAYDTFHEIPGLWERKGVRDSIEQRAQETARNGS